MSLLVRALVAAALGLLGTAAPPAGAAPVRAGAPLAVPCAGGPPLVVDVAWTFPAGRARGVVLLQHGFGRSARPLTSLADGLAGAGLVVAAPSVPSFGRCALTAPAALAPGLAAAIARGALGRSARAARRAAGLPARALPRRLVLAGHSAGGAAVVALAAALRPLPAGGRLRGLVLLDPVESRDGAMATGLPALRGLPVRAITAPASSCNARGSGWRALRGARRGFVGVRLVHGCHCDAEGATTDALCTVVCGRPRPVDARTLRRLAAVWARGLATGRRPAAFEPGGRGLAALVRAGIAVPLVGAR